MRECVRERERECEKEWWGVKRANDKSLQIYFIMISDVCCECLLD